MAKDERSTYTIQNDPNIGEVKIADEVVAIIAALAATEVEGVASMAGNIKNELISMLGMKNLSKGVKVDVLEGIVTVSLALNIKSDYCRGFQEGTGKGKECRRKYDRSGSGRCKHQDSRCCDGGRSISFSLQKTDRV